MVQAADFTSLVDYDGDSYLCAVDGRGEAVVSATLASTALKPNGKSAWKPLKKQEQTIGFKYGNKSGPLRSLKVLGGPAGKPLLFAVLNERDMIGSAFPCDANEHLCTEPSEVCTHVYADGGDSGSFYTRLCFDADDVKLNRAAVDGKPGKFKATARCPKG